MTIDASRTTPTGLHPRLTVVQVTGAPGDAHQLATCFVGEPIDVFLLDAAARERAAASHERRVRHHEATIARLEAERDMAKDIRDAAKAAVAALVRRRAQIVDGARWCDEEGSVVPSLAAALHGAEEVLVGAREQAARAIARLEHVREQRVAAAAVLEEARAELASLESAHLAEPALRRELEQAVRELQDAERDILAARERHDLADAALRATAEAATQVDSDLASFPAVDPGAVEALRAAIESVEAALAGPPDPAAVALAGAITAAETELDRVRGTLVTVPEPGGLEAAEARLADAERQLIEAKAAMHVRRDPPLWWNELGVLHCEVVDAEAKVSGRSRASRQRHEAALAAERALLDELGFDNYIDALVSGGRRPNEAPSVAATSVSAAETEVAAALVHLDEARELAQLAAPYLAVLVERDRLVAQATALVDADPADDLLAVLSEHRSVPRDAQDGLVDALVAVGAPSPEAGPVEAARSWLARYDATADPARQAELREKRATLAGEHAQLDADVARAMEDLSRLDESAATARRAVARFEAELHSRVHGNTDPTQRAVSAAALDDRITTLETQLQDASVRAEREVTETAAAAEAATDERDKTRTALLSRARHAGKLADEIAHERRPAFDALANVGALGGALRAEAEIVETEIASADSRLAEASQALVDETAEVDRHKSIEVDDEPTADDAIAALTDLLADDGSGVLAVVVEPLVPESADLATPLLDIVLGASEDRPVLLVTTDHDTIAWAIELPADQGAVVALRALIPDDRSLSQR